MGTADLEAQEPLLNRMQASQTLQLQTAQDVIEREEKERERADRCGLRTRLAFFTAMWMVLGIIVGTQVENWTLLTSCYVFVQIVTTIGYGDITVTDPRMKLFMSFYVLVCILLVAGFFSDVVNSIIQQESKMFMKQLKKASNKIEGSGVSDLDADPQSIFQSAIGVSKNKGKKLLDKYIRVGVAALAFAAFVLLGTVFYGTKESCSCSYGATEIKGCIDGPKCASTGGAMKDWVDCFYMAVITLTTVGFGDHSPKSQSGRVFGCFWMALGVGAFGNFVAEFSGAFLTSQRSKSMKTSKDVFKKMDTDHSGCLGPHEFREFALLKWGLVTSKQVAGIDGLFKQMDTNGNGTVSFDELQAYCGT